MKEPETIYNWLRINDSITTSGFLLKDDFDILSKIGVSNIVNLSVENDMHDEVANAIAADMDYIHIPIQFDGPTPQDFIEFCDTLKHLEGEKIHVHCKHNYRASAFLYRYHRDILGWDNEKAKELLLKIWDPVGVWRKFTFGE